MNGSARRRIRNALRPGSNGGDPATTRRWGWKGVLIGLIAIVAGAGAVVVVAVLGSGDAVVVIRSGELKPSAGPLEELRIFDRFTVFADPEFRQPRSSPDLLSVMLLAALAGVSATGYLLTRLSRAAVRERLPAFLGLASLGAAWLALDELLGLHETIGANLPLDVVGVRHNDDAIVALYALAGMLFIGRYRLVFRSSRRAMAALVLGLVLTVVAAGIDVMTPSGAEELVEVAAAAALLVGFMALVLDNLAGAVVGRETVATAAFETVDPRARSTH